MLLIANAQYTGRKSASPLLGKAEKLGHHSELGRIVRKTTCSPSVLALTCFEELDKPGTLEMREIVAQDCQSQDRSVGHNEVRHVKLGVVWL